MRHLITALLSAAVPCAWTVEPGDLRLAFEWYEPGFELEIGPTTRDDMEFDHSFGARISLTQPLDLLQTGDFIAVVSGGYHDARRDADSILLVDMYYQSFTGRVGFGYRAELGDAFVVDMYPYGGIGGISIELGENSDPELLIEGGIQIDAAATFSNGFQLGLGAGFNARWSDHTINDISVSVVDLSPAGYAFLGVRF